MGCLECSRVDWYVGFLIDFSCLPLKALRGHGKWSFHFVGTHFTFIYSDRTLSGVLVLNLTFSKFKSDSLILGNI